MTSSSLYLCTPLLASYVVCPPAIRCTYTAQCSTVYCNQSMIYEHYTGIAAGRRSACKATYSASCNLGSEFRRQISSSPGRLGALSNTLSLEATQSVPAKWHLIPSNGFLIVRRTARLRHHLLRCLLIKHNMRCRSMCRLCVIKLFLV